MKEHYSRCLYVERLDTYSELIPPGSENAEPDGRPRDALGRTAMYRCPVQGCWLQKKAGPRGEVCYKVRADIQSVINFSPHSLVKTSAAD